MFVVFYFTLLFCFLKWLSSMWPLVGVHLLWTLCEFEHSHCHCGVNVLKYTVGMGPSVLPEPVLSKLWYRTTVFLVHCGLMRCPTTGDWYTPRALCLLPDSLQHPHSSVLCLMSSLIRALDVGTVSNYLG